MLRWVAGGLLAVAVNAHGADVICDAAGCMSIKMFSDALTRQLDGRVAGFVSIIGADAPRIVESGTARTAVDPPARKMAADVPINVASVSKLLTAIAVLQSLSARHLDVDAPVAAYLPADWRRGPHVDTITFRELLTHRAGFRNDSNQTSYADLKQQIADGIVLEDKRKVVYNNKNFALFRIILPYLNGFRDTVPERRDAATARAYIEYMRRHIFQPLGIWHADCKPSAADPPALYYPLPPGAAHGIEAGDWTLTCGGGGWVLTANDLFRIMHSLVNDEVLLTASQKALMMKACLGIGCSTHPQKNFRGKDGFIFYDGKKIAVETFAGIFKGKVIAVVIMNSNPGRGVTDIVEDAFAASRTIK